MHQLEATAVFGGIIANLMLWSWALGRLQGSIAAAPTGAPGADSLLRESRFTIGGAPDAVRQYRQTARHDRHSALEAGTWLGQKHAGVSAYRRAVQVLLHLEAEELAPG